MSEQPPPKPTLTCRAILLEEAPESGGRKVFFIEVDVNCPVCGIHKLTIAGHHLRSLHRFLDQTIAEFPEMTRSAEEAGETERYSFTGTRNDPTTS